ncbi:Uncharacterised protein [Bordetella pertussis]|nr:Uncharacterised protein [Bordetella pertussis]CFL89345.1 Uncharacterised protein [Bordetella pertussis]CFM00850.1 Uncharacterised protein [Bordetella pertussis]CFM07926.1 Uncharacterised protein [Bordetella pertussis]CFM17728.1 Uncharacterised protein [Bordetella pertussis]
MRGGKPIARPPFFHERHFHSPLLPPYLAQPGRRRLRTAGLDAFRRQPADVYLHRQHRGDGTGPEPSQQCVRGPVRAVLVRGVRQVLHLARLQQLVVPADHDVPGGVHLGVPDPQYPQDAAGGALVPRARARQQPAGLPAPRPDRGGAAGQRDGTGRDRPAGPVRLRRARAPRWRRHHAGGQERQRQPPGLHLRALGDGHHLHRRPARQRGAGAAAGIVRRQAADRHQRRNGARRHSGQRPAVGQQPQLPGQSLGSGGQQREPGHHRGQRPVAGAAAAVLAAAEEVHGRLLLHRHAQPLPQPGRGHGPRDRRDVRPDHRGQ